jgi:hypothetical protein
VSKLPGSETRALWTLALFAAIQLADGVMTAAGIAQFGPAVEANPLLHAAGDAIGFGPALVAAKTLAILGATVLHIQAKHLPLALLTLAYVAIAIVPWAVLSP